MRASLAALAAGALLSSGIAAAVAIAGTATTGTATVCATATTPAHVVAVDGSPVSTVGGDTATQCATTTYTIPTVTETVGSTTTTAAPTYDSAISYTQTRPAFTPTREIDVTTASALKTAITNLQPGDLVKATAAFTVSSSSSSALTISNRLASPAVIDLTGVSIAYTGTSNYAGVYLANPSNLRIYGGDVTTGTGGTCILAHGSQHILWWGFNAHNCGNSGVSLLTATDGGPVQYDDLQGEISHPGQNLAWDPHSEKGTGEHCAGEMADGSTNFAFTNNRLAFYCHDDPVGEAFAFGSPTSPAPDLGAGTAGETNTLYLKAVNLNCTATSQTCGNAVTLWGHTNLLGLDIRYLEVDNAYGYGIIDQAVSSGNTLNGVTVDYARATNSATAAYPKGLPFWGGALGQTYGDVQPPP